MRTLALLLVTAASLAGWCSAYEPIPRRIPPEGKPIPAEQRESLTDTLESLHREAATLSAHELLPDAGIYLKAVDLALEFGEFYKPESDVPKAQRALAEAKARMEALQREASPWTTQSGLVVRGYRSSIDGSPQPYGLEIPESLDLSGAPVPLYVWLHGRGDTQTDLHFLDERARKHWQFKGLLDDGIVLHPFGRQCIGYKSAGEIDVLEAIDHVVANYNVDPDRIALMGFSMGGAGAWHLGAHYADRWAVMHAGAGFVDVKRYQKLGPEQMPPAMEQTLWGLYDVPAYARNLLNIPVIAYSGEIDKQKDAADYMAEVLMSHGTPLPHIIGPGMGHKYDDPSREKVAGFIKEALAKGRNEVPNRIRLQTRTLRYARHAWLEITGLEAHWQDSRIDANFVQPDSLQLTTRNVASLKVHRPLPKGCKIHLDRSTIALAADSPVTAFQKVDGSWQRVAATPPVQGKKHPGQQGPIDDAFLGPFLVVTPSGHSSDPALDAWVQFELEHFKSRWRALFRGDLRIISDNEVTPDDAARYHLVLFGTPESNKLIPDALATMPLSWPDDPKQVLLSIYPNLKHAGRYVVLNSGPTFREAHDRTNSLQNPKLGDWAIIDLSEPPGAERPGRIVKTGFFDENWQLPE